MKESVVGHDEQFKNLVGDLSESVQKANDPVAIGLMLYSIAEERRSTNLIMRDLNAKIDAITSKIDELESKIETKPEPKRNTLSDRDQEILNYVKTHGMISAQQLQQKFKYKGKNAASARLSKLFHDGWLKKDYAGRKVYYKA